MKYAYLVIAFCMLATAGFAIAFIVDVLKSIWFVQKGKEYKWQSFAIFTDNKDWKSILLWSLALCIGVYGFFRAGSDSIRSEYDEPEVKCDICDSYFPEEYDTRDSWYTICPLCTNKEINDIVRLNTSICTICGNQYQLDRGESGMCWDCYLDESAECNWCGNPAPHELTDGDGFFLCTECMGELMAEKSVMKAIWKVLDS